jgi:hypothetical protein
MLIFAENGKNTFFGFGIFFWEEIVLEENPPKLGKFQRAEFISSKGDR